MTSDPPLPPELAAALRPVLPQLAEDTIAAIGREIPEYARPLEGPFGAGLRIGVERALARFVDAIADPSAVDDASRSTYIELGRGEMLAGRTLDVLLGAYRLGARIAWERFATAAEQAGHPPEVLYALAGAIFAYIDAISAESVEGYAEEQSREAGERARRRRALVRLLAREDALPQDVADAAIEAGWPLPATLAALVLDGDDADSLARHLGPDVVTLAEEGGITAFVADPDAPGRLAQIELAIGGAGAALGPTVAPPRAHHSLSRARAARRLSDAAGLVVADERLLELLLQGEDPTLAADFAANELEAFSSLTPNARRRLLATLRAWLDRPGQVQQVAATLDVHPQTVRYRLAQLRELLGAQLEDPEGRFRLAVALRVASETVN